MTLHEIDDVPVKRSAEKVEIALENLGMATRSEIAWHTKLGNDDITRGLLHLDAAGKIHWGGPRVGWGLTP